MTNWDKVVSEKDLVAAKKLRNKPFITKTERKIALAELNEEGWFEYRTFKDPRLIGVKKEKPFDELFEDKVWLLFANLGFTDMNVDRSFKMQYDFQNSDITQQIDIFAADEETVIIVECKAAHELRDGAFKKNIESLYGQMEGLRKEAQKKYPRSKVKFIWATHNYIMSKADMNKLNEWNIAYFNDATVDYYTELVKHLGSSARYQLLGNLFAKQEIRNMDNKIPAIQGKMGGYTYYSFSIEPEKLLKIGYVLHRNEANKNMMPTYQRLIKKKRLTEVQSFIEQGGYFPNSIIISIDTGGKGLQFDPAATKIETAISKIGILHLPRQYRSAYVIDGQHRLYGYSDSPYASSNTVPVVAFVDLEREEQIKLFMNINENQKAVSKTLRVTLHADMLWVSEDYNEQRQALRSKIAQMLGEEETSPLFGRVVVGENEKTPTKCITIEAVQSALKKCNFFTQFGKRNVIVKDGTYDIGTNDETCRIFYPFIEECLRYIKLNLEEEWSKDENENGLLTINRGIQGIIRLINDIVNHLSENGTISPKENKNEDVITEVIYYLDPLITFFSAVTPEQRKELRGFFGGGADTRFWRTFQKAVADVRNDFCPEGLTKYWDDEAKTYNDESSSYLRDIESNLKELIGSRLKAAHGQNWLIHGLPKAVYTSAKKDADEQTYDIIARGGTRDSVTIWDCVSTADCKDIAIYGKNWSEIFESLLTRPEEQKMQGGKDKKTDWISRLSILKNKLIKSSYSISKEEYDFIADIHSWLLTVK